MRKLQWHGTIAAAALAAFCLASPLTAQTGSAHTPASANGANGVNGISGATTPGTAGLPSAADTNPAMNGGAGTAVPVAGATGALPDTNSAAGTYVPTTGTNGGSHNWGWIGIFGLFGLFGLGGRGTRTTTRVERDIEAPDVVTRP